MAKEHVWQLKSPPKYCSCKLVVYFIFKHTFPIKPAVNCWYTYLIFKHTHIVTCDAANTCGSAQRKTKKSEHFRVLQSRGLIFVLAQRSFGCFLRLVSAAGHVLNDPKKSLEAAGIHDGDHVTAVAQQAKLAATAAAFALWFDGEHKIITWGHRAVTGNSYAVRNNVESVHLVLGTRISLQEEVPQQFQYKAGAFAAILEDGSVVTWGHSAAAIALMSGINPGRRFCCYLGRSRLWQ